MSNRAVVVEVPMTLVVVTPTRDGIVMAADRRTCDPVRGLRDNLTKVAAVGPSTVLALTGRPVFELWTAPMFTTLYDAEAEIREFYRTIEPSFPETTASLSDRLCSGFERFLATLSFFDWPESGEPLYQAVFAHWGGRCQLVVAKFFCEKSPERPVLGMRWVEVQAEKLAYARAVPFGNLAVVGEIRHGTDPRFDDLRNHPGVRRFLFDRTLADAVSAEEAADFSQFLVQECSRRIPHLIGPTCDVVVVGKAGGVFSMSERR